MTLAMNDNEETGKLVENIYKNILDKFGPGARHLIIAGKTYLKALHGASAAAKQYMDAVTRLAQQAQQGTWGATNDIGSTLLQFAEVDREIQAQHLNILKAFYVDVLVPLENSLEKDTKVIQNEQKKFQQQFRMRQDNFQKALRAVKKQRNKTKTGRSANNLEKEFKTTQSLQEEKNKLDGFCEHGLQYALTQERKRYGFVLERQCSLAKHYLAFYTKGENLLKNRLADWQDVAKTRDYLPEHIQAMFPPNEHAHSLTHNGMYPLDRSIGVNDALNHEDSVSITLRKARSMDASSMDLRSLSEAIDPPDRHGPGPVAPAMTRAKSDFNLSSSHQSLVNDVTRPRSMVVSDDSSKRLLAKALYSYLSSGEHQLSFHEGDIMAIIGERNKGWQYGENLRTRRSGWFPVAYTVMVDEDEHTPTSSPHHHRVSIAISDFASPTFDPFSLHYPNSRTLPTSASWTSPPPNSAVDRANWNKSASPAVASRVSPPPPPPPPLPSFSDLQGRNTVSGPPLRPYTPDRERHMMHRSLTSPAPLRVPNTPAGGRSTSHHSSNDSGFGNDGNPPPPPDADYTCSDEDAFIDNVFATVRLRKTKTNDRSAPKIA